MLRAHQQFEAHEIIDKAFILNQKIQATQYAPRAIL
jgi:hypothetical protein